MKVQIIERDNIEIVPKAFEGEENPPVFVLRYPNSYDLMRSLQGIANEKILDDMFIECKNLVFMDKEGSEKALQRYSAMFELTFDPRFVESHIEILQKVTELFSKLIEEGQKKEKKSV